MANPDKFRDRYLRFLIYSHVDRFSGQPNEQDIICNCFARYSDLYRQLSTDEYIRTIIDMFTAAAIEKVDYKTMFEEMERWRLKCLDKFGVTSGNERTLYRSDEKTKVRIIQRYFAYRDISILLAETIITRYPLSAEALQIKRDLADFIAVDSKPELSQKTERSRPVRTEYPEEMGSELAAEYLNTTTESLYQLTHKREIPHYKRGHKLVFLLSDLKNWKLSKVLTNDELNTITETRMYLENYKKKK
jgi:excisionase family DNA binding protein